MDLKNTLKSIVGVVTEHADEILLIAGGGPGIIAVTKAVQSTVKLIDKVKDTLELPSDQIALLDDKRDKLTRVTAHADRVADKLLG